MPKHIKKIMPLGQQSDTTQANQQRIHGSSVMSGLESQLEELAKAVYFIFMEYFIIEDKELWRRIQDVLVERVKAGVEVRVFYDDCGSIGYI